MADGLDVVELLVPSALIVAGTILSWFCEQHPSLLPVWAPWDFSWLEFLVTALAVWWYGRGLLLTHPLARPSPWRRLVFLTGVLAIYAVLQTRFEYLTQHMFFLNRIQHLVMHHLGPFLIVIAWPGETLRRGMPDPVRRLIDRPALARIVAVLQQPVLAGTLFVGLIFFWLIPSVHFRAMIDARLYAIMNWTMVVDGLLFWCLVMDPRPCPPARLSLPGRLILVLAVQVPQIAGGAFISFVGRSLYSYYSLCGRIFPSMNAQMDQQIGGFIIWFLGGMMSALAALMIVHRLWTEEG
ncbi:MAG: cytochrome c oxidase assembly protein [Pseudomonadota bacterium]|nr:cytochrome c oxidase assembly protein [Pseudomonadota bacterium]